MATLARVSPLHLDGGIPEFFLGAAQGPGSPQQVTKGEGGPFVAGVEGTQPGRNTGVFQIQSVWLGCAKASPWFTWRPGPGAPSGPECEGLSFVPVSPRAEDGALFLLH